MMNQLSAAERNSFEGKNKAVLYWSLEKDGTLVLEGTGKMQDYYNQERPWEAICDLVKSVLFLEGIQSIGARAFQDCRNLTSITLTTSIQVIHYCAFENCSSLVSVDIPEKLELVHVYSPSGEDFQISRREAASERKLSKSYEKEPEQETAAVVERMAFRNTPWAKKTFGDFLTDGNTLVEYYGDSREVIVPEDIEEIGTFAFKDQPITSVTLPKKLKKIGTGAFQNTCISGIVIPESVTCVCRGAFTGISAPLHIYFENGWTELKNKFTDEKQVYLHAPFLSEARKYAWANKMIFMETEEASSEDSNTYTEQEREKEKRRELAAYVHRVRLGRMKNVQEYFLGKLKTGYLVYCITLDEKREKAEEIEIFAARYLDRKHWSLKMNSLFGGMYHVFYQKRKVSDYPGLGCGSEETETAEPTVRLAPWKHLTWDEVKKCCKNDKYHMIGKEILGVKDCSKETKLYYSDWDRYMSLWEKSRNSEWIPRLEKEVEEEEKGTSRHIWYVSREKCAEEQIGEYRLLKLWKEANRSG